MESIAIIIGKNHGSENLEKCIESVISQSSGNWELYIPESSENIGTKELQTKYKEHGNINFVDRTAGLSYADVHNRIIENVVCEYIGLLDGNDFLDELCVEKVLHFYEAFCNTGLIYTNYRSIEKDNRPGKLGDCVPLKPWQTLLEQEEFGPFLTFRKKDIEKTSKFDPELKNAEHIDIVYKLDEVTKHYFINEPLYYRRTGSGSLTLNNDSNTAANIKTARQKAFKRRGMPNIDNPIVRLLNMDYYPIKKLKYKKGKKVIDPVVGIENLVDAKRVLDKFGMRNWLTDGTLLGYFRDNRFIPHDDDLDIGCFISEYDSRIISEFLRDGWDVDRIFGRQEMGFEISFRRNNLKLDIFFFYEDNGKFWHGAWKKTNRGWNLIKYYYDPFDLKEIEYMGKNLNIPADTKKYVMTKYGETWNKVVKEWDWAYGPPNSVKTNYYL